MNKVINVLLITHHFPPEINGSATRAYEIAQRLIKLQPKVRVFVVSPPPVRPFGRFPIKLKVFQRERFSNNLHVIRVWSYQPRSLNPSIFERLLNYIIFPILALPVIMGLGVASKRIIIITPPSLLSIFVVSLKLLQKKIAVDITDIWHEEAQHLGYIKISLFASLSRGLELLALKLADIVTVATYSIKKYYVSSLGEEDKIHLLPTPLDDSLPKICKETRFKQRANELYNVIVYAGNFGKPQALDFAIKAFSILNKDNVKVRLLLVGGGEEEEYLKHLIKLHKIDNVEIRPPVPREELFNYIYKQSIAGLVALAFNKVLFYAIPTKVYEYIMCGLPFISYGSSVEIKRLSFITKSGIHVSEPEPSKLAEGIKYLMNNIAQFVENANKVSPQLLQQIDNALKLIIE